MSQDVAQVDISVELFPGKAFLIKCPKDKVNALKSSANLVQTKIDEIKKTGRVVGTERIAMMAALNLAYELIENRDLHDNKVADLSGFIQKIEKKLQDNS